MRFRLSKLLHVFAISLFQIIVFVFILRLLQLLILGFGDFNFAQRIITLFRGMLWDLKLLIITLSPLLILKLVTEKRIARIFGYVANVHLVLLFIVEVSLVFYLKKTGSFLGKDIFTYSFQETVFIAGSSFRYPILLLIGILAIAVLVVTFSLSVSNIITRNGVRQQLVIWTIYIFAFFVMLLPQVKAVNLSSYKLFQFASNRTFYLIKELTDKKDFDYSLIDEKGDFLLPKGLEAAIDRFQSSDTINHYVSKRYPLLRERDKRNVLAPYFNEFEKKPNLVFIFVESLSASYSGTNAAYYSFTPFLDSLSQKSLVWDNFISTAGRTYGALPNVFSGLPHGKKGFTLLKHQMPYHTTLLQILNREGYKTNFYYGGYAGFDGSEHFLLRNGADYIIEDLKGLYNKMPANSKGFTWGYEDADVVDFMLKRTVKLEEYPRCDILMTLSIHNPFRVNNMNYWEQIADKRIEEVCSEKHEISYYKKKKNIVACFMHSDHALQTYFNSIKSDPRFNNTIFVITGDHAASGMQSISDIDNFHVPLIIYSPKIKVAKRFKGVATHMNITPSIYNLLNHLYRPIPDLTHWMGNVLDTSEVYSSNLVLPMARYNRIINEAIYKEYYITGGLLYKVADNMKIHREYNDSVKRLLEQYVSDFNQINNYVCHSNSLMPLSNYLDFNLSDYTEVLNFQEFTNNNKGCIHIDSSSNKMDTFIRLDQVKKINIGNFEFEDEKKYSISIDLTIRFDQNLDLDDCPKLSVVFKNGEGKMQRDYVYNLKESMGTSKIEKNNLYHVWLNYDRLLRTDKEQEISTVRIILNKKQEYTLDIKNIEVVMIATDIDQIGE